MARQFPLFPPGPLTWETAATLNEMARELGRLTSGSFHAAGPLGMQDDACGITYTLDPYDIWSGIHLTPGDDTSISGNQDNFVLGGRPWQRIEPTGGNRTITGFFSEEIEGQFVVITNSSTTYYLTLAHDSSSSSAGNRILTSTRNDFVLWQGMSVLVQYDATALAWRIVAKSCDGAGPQYLSQSSTTISSDQTDMDISTLPGPMLSIEPTSANRTIYSIDPGTGLDDGRILVITNTSSTYDLTLAHEYTTGTTASMRIDTATQHDQTLSPGDSVMILYDTTLDRWRTIGQTSSDPAVTFVEALTFAAQQDDLTLTRIGDTLLRVTLTGDQTLTGIDATMLEGTVIWVANVDGSDSLTIANESASSSAANQIVTGTGADVVLAPGQMMGLIYDGTSSRWRAVSQPGVDLSNYFYLPGRSGGQTGKGGTAAGENLTLQSTAHATRGKIILNDQVTCPDTSANTERFGSGASCSQARATAVGNGANGNGTDSVAVGYLALALSSSAVVIGSTCQANQQNAVLVGYSLASSANYQTLIGSNLSPDAVGDFALGHRDQQMRLTFQTTVSGSSQSRSQAAITPGWATAGPDTSQLGKVSIQVFDVTTARTAFTAEATSGAVKTSVHGATAVAKQTVSTNRGNPEGALKDLLAALATWGVITDSTTAAGSSSVTPGGTPVWIGPFTLAHTAFQTASTTNTVDLGYSLPAGAVVHGVKAKHTVQFTKSGGAYATYALTGVGNGASSTKYYATSYSLLAAVSDTTGKVCGMPAPNSAVDIEDVGATTAVKVKVDCSGANLDQSTAGSLDIWLLVSVAV